MPPLKRPRSAACIVAAALAVWAIVQATGSSSNPAPALGEVPILAKSADPASVSTATAMDGLRMSVVDKPGHLRFLVRDDSGRPVPGAEIRLWRDASLRVADSSSSLAFLIADSGGAASLAVDAHEGVDWSTIGATATAPGYAHAWSSAVSTEENVLVLGAACSLKLTCRLVDGSPLSDVRIALCTSQLAAEAALATGVPLGAPEASIHVATSDRDGCCEIQGLRRQTYLVRIEHPFALLKTRLHEGASFVVAGATEAELLFEEPLVAACMLPDRPLLRWVERQMLPIPHPTTSQPTGLLRRLRNEAAAAGLEDHYFAHVVVPSPLTRSNAMGLTAYIPGKGWRHAKVAFVPASKAHVQAMDSVGAVACGRGDLLVEQLAPDGSSSAVPCLNLQLVSLSAPPQGYERLPQPATWPIACGTWLELPCGEYRVAPGTSVYGADLIGERTVTVHEGQRSRITLREQRRLGVLAVDAMTPEGVELGFFHVVAVDRMSGLKHAHTYSRQRRSWYVPVGNYSIEVHLPGFEIGRIDRELPDRPLARVEETIVLSRVSNGSK